MSSRPTRSQIRAEWEGRYGPPLTLRAIEDLIAQAKDADGNPLDPSTWAKPLDHLAASNRENRNQRRQTRLYLETYRGQQRLVHWSRKAVAEIVTPSGSWREIRREYERDGVRTPVERPQVYAIRETLHIGEIATRGIIRGLWQELHELVRTRDLVYRGTGTDQLQPGWASDPYYESSAFAGVLNFTIFEWFRLKRPESWEPVENPINDDGAYIYLEHARKKTL